MPDYSKFVTNIYDPRLPDSDDKLVSESVSDSKRRQVLLTFMRDMLGQYDIGEPCETNSTSFKKLKENNIVGLYRSERTTHLGNIPLLGDFKVPDNATSKVEGEDGGKPTMGFRKRPKQMYKFAKAGLDKNDVLTIDDYVPPPPTRED